MSRSLRQCRALRAAPPACCLSLWELCCFQTTGNRLHGLGVRRQKAWNWSHAGCSPVQTVPIPCGWRWSTFCNLCVLRLWGQAYSWMGGYGGAVCLGRVWKLGMMYSYCCCSPEHPWPQKEPLHLWKRFKCMSAPISVSSNTHQLHLKHIFMNTFLA